MIPPVLHSHFHLQLLLPQGKWDDTCEPSKQQCSFLIRSALAFTFRSCVGGYVQSIMLISRSGTKTWW